MGAKWQIPFLITEIYFTKYDLTWNITCFFKVDSKFCTKLIVYSSVSWKFEFCVWISKQLWTSLVMKKQVCISQSENIWTTCFFLTRSYRPAANFFILSLDIQHIEKENNWLLQNFELADEKVFCSS